ncbi:MAG: hypothetical protein PHQ34_00415 [Methanothrix sp.]|nr:hypothetical protein [Methanothrix sp.]
MRPTLADSIQVLIPNLSPALVSVPFAQRLIDMAESLPPIVNGLIECQLGADNLQADISQHILIDNREPDILMRHIINSGLSDIPVWRRVHEFCLQWQEQSSLMHGVVDGIGFELDADACSRQPHLPSFFMRMKKDRHSADEKQSALEEGLQILFGKTRPFPWQDVLHRCFEFREARLIYIGAMLARNEDALRAEFIPQSAGSIIPLLKHIGWSWDESQLKALIEWLIQLGACINLLHVDLGSEILPKIGISCLCGVGPEGRPDWPTLLDHLVEAGLCLPQKRDGLLAWEGFADPTSSSITWPPDIIVQSLMKPDLLSIFERDISHIKILYQPGKPLAAKAYLRFGHRWLKPEECSMVINDVRQC